MVDAGPFYNCFTELEIAIQSQFAFQICDDILNGIIPELSEEQVNAGTAGELVHVIIREHRARLR